jgi:alpha-amylase/alpha-mannosidase (GH57 family)
MTEQLSVCFIWHMHQPLYKDRLTGKYLLPWVRLHAIKDYFDMVKVLEEFPKIRQTFNLVPSLIEQIEDYAHNEAVDEQLLLTIKAETEYTQEDKLYILAESFHSNLERQIKVHAPYLQLYLKRQKFLDKRLTYEEMLDQFCDQEYADMATWMNLAWFDPMWQKSIDEVKQLIQQGKNFVLNQRKQLIQVQRDLIKQIIPYYRKMQEEGQIEVTTTPYYHPILPLLIDTNSARLADPNVNLPQKLFFHRDDAIHQVKVGLDLYDRTMGQKARGMWPSEMSISPGALEIIANQGINWVIADEALLNKSTGLSIYRDQYGNLNSADTLCQPYELAVGDEKITMLFRELVLSNELSFSYGSRTAEEAASAMYMRLKHIQQRLFNSSREGVVAIALDGENCWETYEEDGGPFLHELYKRLSKDSTLNICTVSDYLGRQPASAKLERIATGSWISADFHIWIGDPEKNRAWDLLSNTRNFLVEQIKQNSYSETIKVAAWEEIYAAEGSDWFWWFGEPNNSAHDAIFDQQFRLRLQNVYKILGQTYPAELDQVISVPKSAREDSLVAMFKDIE